MATLTNNPYAALGKDGSGGGSESDGAGQPSSQQGKSQREQMVSKILNGCCQRENVCQKGISMLNRRRICIETSKDSADVAVQVYSYLVFLENQENFHPEVNPVLEWTIASDLEPSNETLEGQALIVNDEGRDLLQRIVEGEYQPQWLKEKLEKRLSVQLVELYWPDRMPELLDRVLDWANKWASVRFRYQVMVAEHFPHRHQLGYFLADPFHTAQLAVQSNINRGTIHAPDPDGDALLNLVGWFPTENRRILQRSTMTTGTETADMAGFRFFLCYKMSAREMRWILKARDNETGEKSVFLRGCWIT
ncbi:uncharacterized protein PG998_006809 [Apiospora kogelbergensis]|uniref:uncharacterized protein n=1 Tax=Apiospora kogelbergensis TaxID=1337665 RepID=UPI00312F6D47